LGLTAAMGAEVGYIKLTVAAVSVTLTSTFVLVSTGTFYVSKLWLLSALMLLVGSWTRESPYLIWSIVCLVGH